MTSSIDPTKPVTGTPTTSSVRSNFSAAKSEIETLQTGKAPLASPTFTGTLTAADLTATGTITFAGATVADGGSVTTIDINGGTIDGSVIGGTTPAAGDFTALGVTGNITVGGTVDGRDVATDGTKLDGVEAGATADQVWGDITGTLSNQSDLNTALGLKAPLASPTFTGTVTLAALTTTGAVTFGAEIVETVHALTGTTPALDPANGTIQTWTLSGNSSPTDSLSAGESITLHIYDGTSYQITWPTIKWVGGNEPSLDATNETIIQVWKVGSTLYGALVGVAS